ncbi:MAG TPA: hypothetical protein DDY17_08755 [Syntrophaceae bacterium]|jgi:hypothetical protein|nr:hypothetical protein [Syntrophaceae bacterium]
MKCLRCGGLMIYEEFYNPQESFSGLKCLICGEAIDPIILENRKLISTIQRMSPRQVRRSKVVHHPLKGTERMRMMLEA